MNCAVCGLPLARYIHEFRVGPMPGQHRKADWTIIGPLRFVMTARKLVAAFCGPEHSLEWVSRKDG